MKTKSTKYIIALCAMLVVSAASTFIIVKRPQTGILRKHIPIPATECTRLKILYYEFGPPEGTDAMSAFSEVLEELEVRTGIEVEIRFADGADWPANSDYSIEEMFEIKLPMFLSIGERPDIVIPPVSILDHNIMHRYIRAGYFVDIGSMLRKLAPDVYSDYPSGLWQACRVDGAEVAFPYSFSYDSFAHWLVMRTEEPLRALREFIQPYSSRVSQDHLGVSEGLETQTDELSVSTTNRRYFEALASHLFGAERLIDAIFPLIYLDTNDNTVATIFEDRSTGLRELLIARHATPRSYFGDNMVSENHRNIVEALCGNGWDVAYIPTHAVFDIIQTNPSSPFPEASPFSYDTMSISENSGMYVLPVDSKDGTIRFRSDDWRFFYVTDLNGKADDVIRLLGMIHTDQDLQNLLRFGLDGKKKLRTVNKRAGFEMDSPYPTSPSINPFVVLASNPSFPQAPYISGDAFDALRLTQLLGQSELAADFTYDETFGAVELDIIKDLCLRPSDMVELLYSDNKDLLSNIPGKILTKLGIDAPDGGVSPLWPSPVNVVTMYEAHLRNWQSFLDDVEPYVTRIAIDAKRQYEAWLRMNELPR